MLCLSYLKPGAFLIASLVVLSRIMAATEPAKFAQLAAGLIPREALLTVAQRLPGNLEGEDWELMAERLRGH